MTQESIMRRATKRAWRIKNLEKARAMNRAYYQKNRENIIAKTSEYQRMHRDKKLKNSKRWRADNPERSRSYTRKYARLHPEIIIMTRYVRRAARHPDRDMKICRMIVDECRRLTETTGIKHVIDHIIPISSGGWHHHHNLQPLPLKINASKNDNPFWEMPGYKSWRDVPESLWPDNLVAEYRKLRQADLAA